MIEIGADTACMLYLVVSILLILFFWFKSVKKLKKKDIVSYSLTSKRCEFCHHQFSESATKKISRCPQCNLLIKS